MKTDSEAIAKWCIAIAMLSAAFGTGIFWGDWLAIAMVWIIAMPITAVLLGFLAGFVLSFLGATEEQPMVWINEDSDELIVGHSDTVIGRMNDADIYEWILIKRPDTGESIKCFFERKFDYENEELELPNNQWFVVNHGALYVAPIEPETHE